MNTTHTPNDPSALLSYDIDEISLPELLDCVLDPEFNIFWDDELRRALWRRIYQRAHWELKQTHRNLSRAEINEKAPEHVAGAIAELNSNTARSSVMRLREDDAQCGFSSLAALLTEAGFTMVDPDQATDVKTPAKPTTATKDEEDFSADDLEEWLDITTSHNTFFQHSPEDPERGSQGALFGVYDLEDSGTRSMLDPDRLSIQKRQKNYWRIKKSNPVQLEKGTAVIIEDTLHHFSGTATEVNGHLFIKRGASYYRLIPPTEKTINHTTTTHNHTTKVEKSLEELGFQMVCNRLLLTK